MKKVLVTGARGFVGRNLCAVMKPDEKIEVHAYDLDSPPEDLSAALERVDYVFHLAGVNRPEDPKEFETGNLGSLEEICLSLKALGRTPKIVLSSSIQADLDNPYGKSKRQAELALKQFTETTGSAGVVYRFKNLFGKWCRPNYNSVTATFCHNIANDLPIQISDPAHEIDLTHIDAVVKAFMDELDSEKIGFSFAEPLASFRISLGDLAARIRTYKEMRTHLVLPDFSSEFENALYGTYLSYLDKKDFLYTLDIKSDQRGSLAEFVKSPTMGQIFISRTHPGVTRGDHYHHTKTEKFLVLEGRGVIRFRHIETDEILEYPVSGEKYQVVDIPPGYTHSIENTGDGVLVTLFWASEMLNHEKPDTFYEKVQS